MSASAIGRQDLADAREALAYWEQRARRLPRRAVRRRREARALAQRWRVAEAERKRYGSGLIGALLLLAVERRLPEPARQLARWTVRTFLALTIAVVAVAVALTVAAVELFLALLRALPS
jgi:hypothetical protein